jgi:hypothetical protein
MLMTRPEVDALAAQARRVLDVLGTCLELPEEVSAAANGLSDALHPFENVVSIDQRLIHTDGPPRCDECSRLNIKLAKWRRGNAQMCDEHRDWLDRVDAMPAVSDVIRRKPTAKPWRPIYS